ncbi:TBCD protein [Pluteus cervinus]|uniref:TBCD protein n=1 Tax=Pluteus cervinus TaxID=181527 RepID=A0ACD3B9V7_9AGAR|nr:TBCD protein [Pluteus cervinus]
MTEEVEDETLHTRFERYDEFCSLQQKILDCPLDVDEITEEEKRDEYMYLQQIWAIFHEYQEQSYLLDPYLEQMILPAVNVFKEHARAASADPSRKWSESRVNRMATLLQTYARFRGAKTIIRFFPHEIADLSIALEYLLTPDDGVLHYQRQWPLRYMLLIWLSLICMIPFDLEQFDEPESLGKTAASLEMVGKRYLGKAGLEREGTCLLLSRLYMRKDGKARWQDFLGWSVQQLDGSIDPLTCIGILRTLCEVVKSGSAEQTSSCIPELLAIANAVEKNGSLDLNTVVRKLKTKLVGRIALRALPVSKITRRRGRTLAGTDTSLDLTVTDGEVDVPEVVETILEQLFQSLQDKDTLVRYSAAKGVARIAEKLPNDFVDQVLDTVLSHFAIHSVAAATIYDLPAIAENTWHGACLSCAEMARRGLISSEKLPELIEWLSKALYFDLRKGAHSIGSSVRDAAAYVLWALARTQDRTGLESHANNLARRLVTVALYDREIPIRRAASAAFQEHVGRTGLFPHGIDVLRKTDFYAVSIRKNAFLIAAPQVAEHPEYRSFLFDHLIDVTVRHWDISMRQLGSQSLRFICQFELSVLGSQAIERANKLLDSVDVADVHGAILVLTEIALACREHDPPDRVTESMRKIYAHLSRVPQDVLYNPRNETVTAAACRLLANTITPAEIEAGEQSTYPHWRKLLEAGLKHRSENVQQEAAAAMNQISKLIDCSDMIKRLIKELKTSTPPVQQSLGRFLGVVDYHTHAECLEPAISCLLESIDPSTSRMKSNVEARRNCYLAIPRIIENGVSNLTTLLSPSAFASLFEALQRGLEDYTSDERGDVGSWIRMACVQGLTTTSELLISNASMIQGFGSYLPPGRYHDAIAGILKQGVERLDNVRQEAGNCIMRLLRLPLPTIDNSIEWSLPGYALLDKLFLLTPEDNRWSDGRWLFPKVVQLLDVPQYRNSVLSGLVISLGSKSQSVQVPVRDSISTYVEGLPLLEHDETGCTVKTLVEELLDRAKPNFTSNTIFIPIIQTFNILVETQALRNLTTHSDGLALLSELLSLASRNATRIKNVQRIQESMKIVVALLTYPELRQASGERLNLFLGHPFPVIRSETAEHLHLTLQGADLEFDTDEVDDILLQTDWAHDAVESCLEASQGVINLLLASGRADSE